MSSAHRWAGWSARYAATPSRDPRHPRRLRIARLFTIASPLSGASLAKVGHLNQLHIDLRPGSEFIKYIDSNSAPAAYELYAYARLHDHLVGEEYSAPAGQNPLWLAGLPLEDAHLGAVCDVRILADIGRRLRYEQPFSKEPITPLPPTTGRSSISMEGALDGQEDEARRPHHPRAQAAL